MNAPSHEHRMYHVDAGSDEMCCQVDGCDYRTGGVEQAPPTYEQQNQRIASLTQERDQLRAEVERLSAPVSDEEWILWRVFNPSYGMRETIDAMVAARRKP